MMSWRRKSRWWTTRGASFPFLYCYFVMLATPHDYSAAQDTTGGHESGLVQRNDDMGARLDDMTATIQDIKQRFDVITNQIEALLDAEEDLANSREPTTDQGITSSYQREPGGTDEKPRIRRISADAGEQLLDGGAIRKEIDDTATENDGGLGGRDALSLKSGFSSPWLAVTVFMHETWLFLQHANILFNPLCQRLDRGYGIALLKRRLYWVIATVLAAYWAREVVSMWLAFRFAAPVTAGMIIASTMYHLAKIALISKDAQRGWSPPLGIMRLLMDHWHLSSMTDWLLSFKRVFLQAFDTSTHGLILRDMLRWDASSGSDGLGLQRTLCIVTVVWAMHAVGNLATRKSTATIVVEVAKGFVSDWKSCATGTPRNRRFFNRIETGLGRSNFGTLDEGRADFTCSASCSHGHIRCEVCHLLTRDRPAGHKRVD